jgi:hypothetical protein
MIILIIVRTVVEGRKLRVMSVNHLDQDRVNVGIGKKTDVKEKDLVHDLIINTVLREADLENIEEEILVNVAEIQEAVVNMVAAEAEVAGMNAIVKGKKKFPKDNRLLKDVL